MGPDITSTTCLEEGLLGTGWGSELKGTEQLHFWVLFLIIHFLPFQKVSVSEGRKSEMAPTGRRVCGSKPTQFQLQHISPNDILWSFVGD